MKLQRLYEDDDFIIINKPAGVLVIPDRFDQSQASLNKLLEAELGHHVYVVHRLDRNTSGTIAFAKNETAHRYLSVLFEAHEVGKFYAGIVKGVVQPEQARIEAPIAKHPAIGGRMVIAKAGKESITDYRVSEQWQGFALMQFRIHTGRTHQIRVHMQHIGHPIVADDVYGDGKPFLLSAIKRKYKPTVSDDGEERPLLSRIALHAYQLTFAAPDGKEITAEAPLPKDMAACVAQLNKWAR